LSGIKRTDSTELLLKILLTLGIKCMNNDINVMFSIFIFSQLNIFVNDIW
jgi:hypothetical protein